MIAETLRHYPHAYLNLISMGLFGVVFVGTVIHVLRGSRRKIYEDASRIPLND